MTSIGYTGCVDSQLIHNYVVTGKNPSICILLLCPVMITFTDDGWMDLALALFFTLNYYSILPILADCYTHNQNDGLMAYSDYGLNNYPVFH